MNKQLSEAIDLVDGIFHSTSFKNQKAINDGWNVIREHLWLAEMTVGANQGLGETLLSLTKELGMDGTTLPTNEQVKATMAKYKKSMEIRDVFIQERDSQISELVLKVGDLEKDLKNYKDLLYYLECKYKKERCRAEELEYELKRCKLG